MFYHEYRLTIHSPPLTSTLLTRSNNTPEDRALQNSTRDERIATNRELHTNTVTTNRTQHERCGRTVRRGYRRGKTYLQESDSEF